MDKKKMIVTLLAATMMLSAAGCGGGTEPAASIADPIADQTTEMTTEALPETTAAPETTTETVQETTTEAPAETAAPTTEAVSASSGAVPTYGEAIAEIDRAFGLFTDGSDSANIEEAKIWDIIDEDAVIDTSAPITAEFLVDAVMRATGFVNGDTPQAEVIQSAIDHGVITDADLTLIDLADTYEIIDRAKDAWMHPDYDNEIHVELVDGVVDLTNEIGTDEFTISGDGSVVLPSRFADRIKEGTVFVLPKDAAGNGGAYKAQKVTENGIHLEISCVPADVSEVYSSIKTY